MFRLLTFCFSAACLAVFVWFGLTVELGDHTLFGHMRAIGSTPEAKQLGEGIKTKVDDFVGIEAARRAAAEAARKQALDEGKSPEEKAGPPQDDHTESDREGLRKVARPGNSAPKQAAKQPAPAQKPAAKPAAKPSTAPAPRPAASPHKASKPQPAATVRRVGAEAGSPK